MKRIMLLAVLLAVSVVFLARPAYADGPGLTKAQEEAIMKAFLADGSGPTKAQAEAIMKAYLQDYFPAKWGSSFLGSKLLKLDLLEVTKVQPIKVPDHLATSCTKVTMVVVHAKGVSRTNNGPVIKNTDNAFDKVGTFMMCVTYQDQLEISLTN